MGERVSRVLIFWVGSTDLSAPVTHAIAIKRTRSEARGRGPLAGAQELKSKLEHHLRLLDEERSCSAEKDSMLEDLRVSRNQRVAALELQLEQLRLQAQKVELHTDTKPSLSRSTTGEFNAPPDIYGRRKNAEDMSGPPSPC